MPSSLAPPLAADVSKRRRRRIISASIGFVWGILVFLACRFILDNRDAVVADAARQAEIEQMILGLFFFLGFTALMFVLGMAVAIVGRSKFGFRGLISGFVSGVALASLSLFLIRGSA